MHSFDKSSSLNAKIQNQGYLDLFYRRLLIPLSAQMIYYTMNCMPKGTQLLLDAIVPIRPVVQVDQPPPPFTRPTNTILIEEYERSMKTEDDAEKAQEIVQLHQEVRVAERELDPDIFNPALIATLPKGVLHMMPQKTDTQNIGFKGVDIRPIAKKHPPTDYSGGGGEGGFNVDAARSGVGKR
ncbi:MAG: hypothetical protein EZS28_026693 [Streblomastix strix]|uniref:Uncharacterized protein n=1 Tax=Streblomastix strix TaxID=222440 RepID=A0A5J4V636_9EUKA|nr:MAG: hypothetical protein EZS28_026693 [Streblomastix strix]